MPSSGGWAVFGNMVLVTRPVASPGLIDDPDWRGRRGLEVHRPDGRRVHQRTVQVRQPVLRPDGPELGPGGPPGIPLSNYGYERQGLAHRDRNADLRLSAFATELQDEIDSLGRTVHRYYFVHRLHARPSRRLTLGLWEGVVLAGADRNFETRYRNPLSLSYLANTIGLGDRGNVILGVDMHWRAFRRATFQAQLAVDDFSVPEPERPTGTTAGRSRSAALGPSAGDLRPGAPVHPGVEPGFSDLQPVRELHRRGRGDRAEFHRHGPAHAPACRCRSRTAGWLTPGADPAAPGRGRHRRSLPVPTPAESVADPAALHRRGRAHLSRGARGQRADRARWISRPMPASITSSTGGTRRVGRWTASRDGFRRRSDLSREGALQ